MLCWRAVFSLSQRSYPSRLFLRSPLKHLRREFEESVCAGQDPGTMTSLDKSTFSRKLELIALQIDAVLTKEYMKALSGYIFKMPRLKSVYAVPNMPSKRYLLLNESVTDASLDTLPEPMKEFNKSKGGEAEPYFLDIGYEHMTVEEVLRKILPPEIDIPSSFEQIGHIAHMNLREETLAYKYIIGRYLQCQLHTTSIAYL